METGCIYAPESNKKEVANILLQKKPSDFTHHSGGALQSDSVWDDVGQAYGINPSKHYYHGTKTPRGNVEISESDFEEGKQHVLKANETLHRKPDAYIDLLARNWKQVKESDGVFAIGSLNKRTGIVDGGTGWAIQMAIDYNKTASRKKPIYVFDLDSKSWFTNIDGNWRKSTTPVLTNHFAGIGTHTKLTEAGFNAIKDVYRNTFPEIDPGIINTSEKLAQEKITQTKEGVKPIFSGYMTFDYNGEKNPNVTADNTIDAIRRGERTATTRFSSDRHIDYWQKAKVGDIIEFTGKDGSSIFVRVTKPLTQLSEDISPEEWSKKEGWSVEHFNSSVKPRIKDGAYQIEFEYVEEGNPAKEKVEKRDRTSEIDKAEEAKFNEWWETVGKSKYPLEEGESIYDEGVLRNHPQRDQILADYNAYSSGRTVDSGSANSDFRMRKRTQMRNVIYAFPSYAIKKMAIETLGEAIDDEIQKAKKDHPEDVDAKLSDLLIYVKPQVKQALEAQVEEIRRKLDTYTEESRIRAEKVIENLENLINNIDGLWSSAIEYYKMFYADITDAARRNEDDAVIGVEDDDNTEADDKSNKEYSGKDAYDDKFGKLSIESTANSLTKEIFFTVIEVDKDGNPIRNAFNRPQKVDPRRIFAVLASALKDLTSQEDMVKRLEDLAKNPNTYWVKGILDKIKNTRNGDKIKNALYVSFNKSNIEYTAQVVLNGITRMKVFDQTDAANELFKKWRFEVQRFEKLEESAESEKGNTIFTDELTLINGEVTRKAILNLEDPLTYFSELVNDDTLTKDDLVAGHSALTALAESFKALGIYLTDEEIYNIFAYNPTAEDYPRQKRGGKNDAEYSKSLLDDISKQMFNILRLVKQNDIVNEHLIRGDLKQLANTLSKCFEPSQQRSQKLGKNVRYNQVNNSFILTQGKNIFSTKEKFDKWADEHWKGDPWYNSAFGANTDVNPEIFKPYSHFIKLLQSNEQERKAVKRVVFIVDKDGNEYEQMSVADLVEAEMVAFLQEYNPEGGASRYAYYRDGLFGDSAKFQFVRMRVYEKEDVARHLSDIVLQEYNRIKRVEKLIAARKAGEKVRINGNLIKNGTKFNFFPELNATTVSKYELQKLLGLDNIETSGSRITFIEALDILQEKNPLKMNEFIQNYLYRVENNEEKGLLVNQVKTDMSFLRREGIAGYYGRREFKTTSAISIERYNRDNNDELTGINGSLASGRDLLTEEELRAFKRKATELIANFDPNIDLDRYKKVRLEYILGEIEKDLQINPAYNIESFLYNRILSSIELFELRDKDLAYYKNYEDYIKRSKQASGDYVSPNPDAPIEEKNPDGTRKSKKTEKILVVKDFAAFTPQKSLDAINKILDKAEADHKITASKAAFVKKKWAEEIKATDGQMYRTIMSKRDLDIMLAFKGSTDEVLKVYETMISDTNPTDEEMRNANKLISSMKEYGYGMPASNMYSPTQLKNGTQIIQTSEKNGGVYHYMPVLRALQEFAEEYGFDAIAFESGIKVGLGIESGKSPIEGWDCDSINLDAIDPNSPTAYQDAKGLILEEYALKSDFCTIDFDYEFHGEQTKEGNFEENDPYMAVGTQTSKIIPSILLNSGEVELSKGRKLSGRQAFNLYQSVAALRMIGEWGRVKEVFRNNNTLHSKLVGSILASKKYNAELFEGMEVDEEGKPLVPYNDITIRNIFEDKLLAFGRRSLSKVLTPSLGSHFFTASDAGLDAAHKLEVKYNADGTLRYVPCYLPAYYKEWIEDCLTLNEDNCFSIDIDKLKRKYKNKEIPANVYTRMYDLFECIGYRVPSEGMCSIIPLRVAGFMPLTNQSTIILPSEMITKTGEDMDGDEIFFIKHASRKYNKRDFIRDNHLEELSAEEQDAEWEKKKDYYKNTIVKVEYRVSDALLAALSGEKPMTEDIYKELSNMSQMQLHNLLLDLMLAATRTYEGTLEGIQFSSFEDIEKTAAIINLINKSSLKDEELGKKATSALHKTSEEIKKDIEGTDTVSPMTLSASMKSSEEALAGKKFLSIFAVGKAVGAITQATQTRVMGGPVIGGKRLEHLSMYYHIDNSETPSTNNAELVAACPDNSKNPTIAAFGVNKTTVNVIQLLAQAGYSLTTIGLLMNQPIIKQMSRNIELLGLRPNMTTIRNTIQEFLSLYGTDLKYNEFFTEDIVKKIFDGSILDTSDESLISSLVETRGDMFRTFKGEVMKKQLYIGVLFLKLFEIADKYNKRGRCLRGDSNSGNAASSVEETLTRIQNVKDYVAEAASDSPFQENFPISDPDYTPLDNESDKSVFRHIMDSSFPLANAQYILGLKGLMGQLSKIFPEVNPAWTDAIFSQRNFSKKNFKINDLYTFMWHKKLQDDSSKPKSDEIVRIVIGMPQRLQNLKDNPKYSDNTFIKNLGFDIRRIGNSDKSMTIIMARANANDGAVNTTQIPSVVDGWKQLNEDSDPVVRRFAKDMLLYFMYVYGNTYKKGSLATFRPNSIVLDIPGYIEGLEDMAKAPTQEMLENYKKQSLLNHMQEYAFLISEDQKKELGIEEFDTYDEIVEKLSIPVEVKKSVPLLKVESSDEKFVYLMDVSTNPAVSMYQVVTPKNVYLEGLSIINMDSDVDSKDLVDLEKVFIENAEKSYPIAKNSKTKYKKNSARLFDAKTTEDEVGEEKVNAATEDNNTDTERETEPKGTVVEMNDDELADFFGGVDVTNIPNNTNNDGNITDSQGNEMCK